MASTETKELELVGKVEMKIALAKDDKLEGILKIYLPPLLLKLGSDHLSVRNKVISTCQHVKVRLSGNQSIVLPVASLLKQYKENADQSMIRHFDLVFIQQSIGKLSATEQMDLIPVLLHGISKDASKPTCSTVFNLFLRLLPRLRLPLKGSKEDSELRVRLGLEENSADAEFTAQWFKKLMLFVPIRLAPLTPSGASVTQPVTCPGLLPEEYDFLSLSGKPGTWDPTASEGLNLTETKITVLNFLASGAFTDTERFLPALFATADSNSRISSIGDDILKRMVVPLEDKAQMSSLYDAYFNFKPALQTRILTLFSRSAVATTFPNKIIQIVETGMGIEQGNLTPAKGLESQKFRKALFIFVNWVSRIGSQEDLSTIAPPLVESVRGYIENQGWPVPDDRSSEAAALRALAYEALGSMAKTTPSIVVEPALDVVRWLFRSLTEEGSSDTIFVSIEGALASILSAFISPNTPPLNSRLKVRLRTLLLEYMTLEEGDKIVRSARFATVRWANRCLPFDDIVGRWIDILALGSRPDERSDVVEEGKKGLDPYWYRLLNSTSATRHIPLPHLSETILSFFTDHSMLEESSIANGMITGMQIDKASVVGKFSGTKINAFAPSVSFLRRMIFIQALEGTETALSIDADWERQLDVLIRSDMDSRKAIKSFLEVRVDEDALKIYLTAAFEGILWNEGHGLPECGKCFVEVGSLVPTQVLGYIASRAAELMPSVYSNNAATRYTASQAFGMLAPHPANSDKKLHSILGSIVESVMPWRTAVGAEANKVHGAIVAAGYLLSRAVLYGRSDSIDRGLLQEFIKQMLEILKDTQNASAREAALTSMGLLCATGLFSSTNFENLPSDNGDGDLIAELTTHAKKSDEKAIAALGKLAMVFDEPSGDSDDHGPLPKILQVLYDLQEIKQAEVHFTVGEALSCAAACWDSQSLVLSLDVSVPYKGKPSRPSTLKTMMDKLLKDCKTTKPSLKKASGIWLFCLIQHCGHLHEVQTRLRECQAAFMGLLSARDDLVQETASRGLSLVYEQGDKELKERLVEDLVASFTGTSTKLKVEQDTELFEKGALPTGDGQSVTSYKDIISLANEVGDSSLVYKFMSLASNAATWSTRAAFGRFGLSNILSTSEVDPKLYPKLYRYRFDPNPNVQRSMNDIWNALVKDSNATIDKHFDPIIEDLLKNIVGKEWRTRQASCAAIADLVQGRQFEKYEKYVGQIWEMTFKVIDDIKGSVRKAAMLLSMALTGILVRQLEAGSSTVSKNAQIMLEKVLPFLLSSQGLESSAQEVKLFALNAVLNIVKNGGKTLLPFIPTLVESLIGLMGTLEDEKVSYAYFRAEDYGTTQEKIDEARSGAVTSSPMMEAVERCLDLLDEETMAKLVTPLENIIRTAVGVPSKLGCSVVLVSLSTRHSFVFKPHADGFLKLLEKAAVDRNPTVSSAYARAAGYTARVATDKAILRLSTYSKEKYFAAEDETPRQISADIIYSVSKFATDRFNSLASEFLPFVFLAKHDSDNHVSETFEKTWTENVGGSRAVLLYLNEIINLSTMRLDSPKWTIKHSSALTIADVVTSSGDEISLANCKIVWPALEKALALKTFEGKEKVLSAFVKFVKSGKTLWENDTAMAASMKKIALREAKRNNEAYRPHAYTTLGGFAEARTDIDMFDDVYGIIEPYIEELIDEDKMDIDKDEKDKKSTGAIELQTLNTGISALIKSINITQDRSTLTPHLDILLPLLQKIIRNTTVTSISTKTIIYEQLKNMFKGLSKRAHSQRDPRYDIVKEYFGLLEVGSGVGGETVRIKRAEAVEMVVKSFGAGNFGLFQEGRAEVKSALGGGIEDGLDGERSVAVREILERAMKMLVERD